jgi:hypothetical protein
VQRLLKESPINSDRVVKIERLAAQERQMRTVAVKVVEGKTLAAGTQPSLDFFSEPGFARAAAANNRDE